MSKWIRWSGLIAFIVIGAALSAFFLLLAGPLTKAAIEKYGTAANGALVEVDHVSLSFRPLGIKIEGLAVTDAEKPMTNALIFDSAVAELELGPLFLGKGIIRELSIDGMQFGTARTVSGAVAKKAETAKESDESLLNDLADNIELPDAEDILARESLRTDAAGDAFNKGFEYHKQQIQERLGAVPDDDALKAYEDELKALTSDSFRSLDDFRERKKKLDELQARFKADQKAVAAARQAVSDGRKEITVLLDDLKDAPGADLKALREKYGLDAEGAANISALLFGAEAGEWAKQTLYWYEKVKPYLAKKEADAEEKQEAAIPRGGRFIHFPSSDPWPSFLLREARITARLSSGNLLIKAIDITHQQPVLGRPALIKVNSSEMSNMDELSIDIVLDHRSEPGRDSLMLSVSNWHPGSMKLGVAGAELASSRVQIQAQAVVSDGNLTADAKAIFNESDFRSDGKTVFAKELGAALAGIRVFDVTMDAKGRLSSPKISIDSDLDRQLKQALNMRIKQKRDELEAKLRTEIQRKLQQYLGDSADEIEQLVQMEGSLDQRLDKLGKLAGAQLEDYAAQQERIAREKADRKKKEAEQKAKEQLKKLF